MNDTTVIGPAGLDDLAERAAESGGPLGGQLGEPEAYAAELRSAAGLPPRVDVVLPDAVRREPWTDRVVRDAHDLVARHPWLRELRPTWWLARGALAGWLVTPVLGTGRIVLLPLVGAALSMWLGLVLRRREPLGTGVRVALAGANALAVVLLLAMLASFTSEPPADPEEIFDSPKWSGVSLGGELLPNLYVYDAAGHRVEGARIFDPMGIPLFVDPRTLPLSDPDLPLRADNGHPDVATDVFPLRWGGRDPWRDPGLGWTPPQTLPSLAGAAGAPTPSASASSSPSPSSTP